MGFGWLWGWREFVLELVGDRLDGGGRMGIGGEELPVFLQGEWPVFEVLVGGDSGVEQGGGMPAGFSGGGGELPERFGIAAALDEGEADTIEGWGAMGVELEDAGVAAFGGIYLAQLPVRAGEPHPAISVVGLQRDVSGEFGGSGGGIALIEVKTTEVVAGGGQVAVEGQGSLVGGGGIVGLPGAVIGESEEVPSLGTVGEESGCLLERRDGADELAGLDEAFSFEGGAGAGWGATGGEEEGCQASHDEEGTGRSPGTAGDPAEVRAGRNRLWLFGGQHLGGW